MRIIQLTESEAANDQVMSGVMKYLLNAPGADLSHVDVNSPSFIAASAEITGRFEAIGTQSAMAAQEQRNVADTKIAAADLPSAGFPPDPPAAAPRPDPSDPATIGFGTQPAMVLPFPGATVPVAANLVIPAPPTAGAADLDSKGLPWDPRIHSSGDNKKNADGSWRKKRGVPDTLVAEVEAELRQIMAIPALAQAPVAAPVIPLPPIPAAPAPAPAPLPAAEAITFSTWMEELTPALNRQLITQELFLQLTKNAYGPESSMNALVMKPELIPPVRQALKEWLDANHPGWANAAA